MRNYLLNQCLFLERLSQEKTGYELRFHGEVGDQAGSVAITDKELSTSSSMAIAVTGCILELEDELMDRHIESTLAALAAPLP